MQKPVVPSELLRTILQLSGTSQAEDLSRIEPAMRMSRELNVLLAEDGIVNQQVAIGLLEQHGHNVVVANDGQEAIAALEHESFDLVLMDVQMPNMDGHEATRIIRELEQTTGRHTPIVAMTAGAMKGDAERCFESGMDGYVSKPIDPQLLYDTIEQCLDATNGDETDASEYGPTDNNEPIPRATADQRPVPDDRSLMDGRGIVDLDAVRELCCGNDERMRSLAETLLGESTLLMTNIREAFELGDVICLRRHAHSLKGAASVFDATRVVETALNLEMLGEEGNLDGIRGPLADLEDEVSQLTAVLRSLADSQ